MRFLILILIFVCSCSGDKTPGGVLPPKKMEAVFYDLIRSDEWVDFAVLQDSTFRKFSRRAALYDSVFRLHDISKDQYRQSINFYQGRPDLLKEIFESLRVKSDTAMKRAQDALAKTKTDSVKPLPVDTLVKTDSVTRPSIKSLRNLRR